MIMEKYILGIDIGGTRIRLGLVDRRYRLYREKAEFMANYDMDHFLPSLFEIIGGYISETSCGKDLAAISVGVPATVSKDKKVVLSTPNVQGLNNVRLPEVLEKQFGLRAFMDRDVNFLLYHDAEKLKIPPEENVIACYMGTGIGNVIRLNGRVLSGRTGTACELGHIPVAGNRRPCVCGNIGCVETVASGKYLTQLCEQTFHDPDIANVFVNHGQAAEIREFVEVMAIPVATEINIFDPDCVIIGGGILAMRGFPRQVFEEHILDHVRTPFPRQGLVLKYATDDAFGGVRGAGMYAFDQIKEDTNVSLYR